MAVQYTNEEITGIILVYGDVFVKRISFAPISINSGDARTVMTPGGRYSKSNLNKSL